MCRQTRPPATTERQPYCLKVRWDGRASCQKTSRRGAAWKRPASLARHRHRDPSSGQATTATKSEGAALEPPEKQTDETAFCRRRSCSQRRISPLPTRQDHAMHRHLTARDSLQITGQKARTYPIYCTSASPPPSLAGKAAGEARDQPGRRRRSQVLFRKREKARGEIRGKTQNTKPRIFLQMKIMVLHSK
jgi:hypothetical protein